MQPLTFQAQVTSVTPLNERTRFVVLTLPEAALFEPGQYLEIAVDETTWLPYSLACLPGSEQVSLHIQIQPGSSLEAFWQARLVVGGALSVRLPLGQCTFSGPDRPLVFVAAGTGFAQMQALLCAAFAAQWQSPLCLYWGGRQAEDLYAQAQLAAWQASYANFDYHLVVEYPDAQWQGRSGTLVDALAVDFTGPQSAVAVEGFASGSPGMVYAVEDFLMSRGMPARGLNSDVHTYAPRDLNA